MCGSVVELCVVAQRWVSAPVRLGVASRGADLKRPASCGAAPYCLSRSDGEVHRAVLCTLTKSCEVVRSRAPSCAVARRRAQSRAELRTTSAWLEPGASAPLSCVDGVPRSSTSAPFRRSPRCSCKVAWSWHLLRSVADPRRPYSPTSPPSGTVRDVTPAKRRATSKQGVLATATATRSVHRRGTPRP